MKESKYMSLNLQVHIYKGLCIVSFVLPYHLAFLTQVWGAKPNWDVEEKIIWYTLYNLLLTMEVCGLKYK